MWRLASATDSYRPDSQDRMVAVARDGFAVAAVADGVGGRSGGGEAAEMVARAASALAENPSAFLADPLRWLTELDLAISRDETAGETTAVVAVLTPLGAVGVAVGDSAAWDILPATFRILTCGSEHKPWLGWGSPAVRPFAVPQQHAGTLLFATDGLLKYAASERIRAEVLSRPFDEIPRRLIDAARRPSGGLNDDVAVVVSRWEPTG